MPLSISDAVEQSADVAATKARQARSVSRYMTSSALAGGYIGVAVVLLVSVSAPVVAAGSPFAKLVQGSVFGIALTLVVFAGAELFTGNNMFMLQGLFSGKVRASDVAAVWSVSLVGNLVGSVGFAALVHGAGTLGASTAGTPPAGERLVASIVETKNAAAGPQLFWRAVLCNLLVCLGLWMAARATSDGAKLVVVWWALLAFIASGFEHSVANMTLFSLGVFEGSAAWADLARNLLWTVPGNIVGGGVLVGVVYTYLADRPAAARVDAASHPAAADDTEIPEANAAHLPRQSRNDAADRAALSPAEVAR